MAWSHPKGEGVANGAKNIRNSSGAKSKRAKIISSELMYQGRVFGVRREKVIEPSGVTAIRERITHNGSVVVLPVFPDGRILLIRQYRHAAAQYLWELVAGHRDEGEDFVVGAKRELEEETGYTAKRFKKLIDIYPSPGLLSEKMEIFLAEGLTKGEARPEEDEKIESRIFTLPEILKWIRAGKILDSKSVAGILYYATFLARSKSR
jgi:ADP-ribose pyrophosphatase